MRNQLYWVGVTYVRRPLFLVVTLALLAAVAYVVSTNNDNRMRQSYPRFKATGLRVHSYEEFQKLRAEGRLQEIGSLSFMSLLGDKMRHLARAIEGVQGNAVYIDEINAQELIKECAPATEIVEIEFAGFLPDLDFGWLSQFQKLRHFEILSQPVNKPWVARLGQLAELERLSITSCQSLEGIGKLANLKKLQTLKLEGIKQFSDRDLREISRLPQLRTLILLPHSVAAFPKPNEPKNSVTDAGLALLRDMPNLQTVYVNQFALERVRSILPNKRVLRSNYSTSRVTNLGLLEFALTLLFAVVYFHLAGQASLFLGRIAPRFTASHLFVPAGIVTAAILLGTLCLSVGNSRMLPALSACLLVLASMDWWFLLFLGVRKKEGLVGALFGLSIGFGPYAMGLLLMYFAPEIDAFLLGDFPGICAAVLILSSLTILVVLRYLARLPLRMAESGRTTSVNLADIKASAEANNKQNIQTHWPFKIVSNILDRQIARGFHGNQQSQRISLWNAATPGMGRRQKVFLTIAIGSWLGYVVVRDRNDPDTYLVLALVAPLFVGMLWLFGSSLTWHFRLKHFAYELLRPVSRRSLRADFFCSLLGDLGVSLCMTLPLATITYFLYRNAVFEITPWIPSLCFFTGGGLIFGTGVLASIALIRKSWLAVTVLALIYFSGMMLPAFAASADWELTTAGLARVTVALGLLGIVALVFAWRRFLSIEWGKG